MPVKTGKKYDDGKPMWHLLPFSAVSKIVEILTFGCKKYGPNQWQELDDFDNRFFSAALRHLTAWRDGEKVDNESGLSHLAHAGCCILFLIFNENRKQK